MVKFINRLTGKITENLPKNIQLGEWQLITENETIIINNVQIEPDSNIYLWGDSKNNCFLNFTSTNKQNFKIPKWQIIPDLLQQSIRFFYHEWQKLQDDQSYWENWLTLSPLFPEINEKIHLLLLEKQLEEKWGHLETVCRRPRTYLKMEMEKLPISRSKKIAPRAIEYLASHTEDWHRRNFNSVKPKNLLCLVREDLLNIYENQVTAKLIDYLLEYLTRRIQELNLIKAELKETIDFSHETQQIHWRNSRRICSLWGENFDAEIGIRELEESLKQLNQLRQKLLGLINTDLYKAIPPQVYIPITLKRTNIFVNDQHYKYIDLLWRNWSKWQRGQLINPQQLYQQNQELYQGFSAFCLLLICKAFVGNNTTYDQGFGFNFVFNNNNCLNFEGMLGEITLNYSKQNTFILQDKKIRKELHIIPLLINLTALKDERKIELVLDELISKINNSVNNIILYLGTKEEREVLSISLQKKLNSIKIDQNYNLLGIFPVSPLEILSVERVASGLKWWLNGQIYLSFPPLLEMNIPEENLLKHLQDAIEKTSNNQQFRVIKSLSTKAKDNFNIELSKLINKTESMGKLAIDMLNKLNMIKQQNIPDQIEQLIKPFLICPTCQNSNNEANFQLLEHQTFQCTCNNCQTTWGTKKCGKCQKNYPFIDLQGIDPQQINDNRLTLDRVLGRDILAIPYKKGNNTIFTCCFCGSN